MSKPAIGFIGLGLMGRAMVECLQNNDYHIAVLGNRDRTGVEEALARGGTEGKSAKDLAGNCDIVMLCVGTSEQVESRIYGDDGVLAGAKDGQIIIDFGTSLPASTIKIGGDLAEKGAAYLDAPLGRTPAHAKDGLLNIMCAGDRQAYDRVKPVLDTLGENVFHLGKLGNGHTIKLLNNFYSQTILCAMAEAYATARQAGIDPKDLYDVMAAGPNRSGIMDFLNNYITEGKIDLAFSVANAAKDVGYYQTMAGDLKLESRMCPATLKALREAHDDKGNEFLVPQMVDWFAENLEKKP
jgi:3-hydroxyisobutyrate dehydrogenase-like beta-hydroxyacid dehydrogenase